MQQAPTAAQGLGSEAEQRLDMALVEGLTRYPTIRPPDSPATQTQVQRHFN